MDKTHLGYTTQYNTQIQLTPGITVNITTAHFKLLKHFVEKAQN